MLWVVAPVYIHVGDCRLVTSINLSILICFCMHCGGEGERKTETETCKIHMHISGNMTLVQIDPQLYACRSCPFQRSNLISILYCLDSYLGDGSRHDLCSFPPLFSPSACCIWDLDQQCRHWRYTCHSGAWRAHAARVQVWQQLGQLGHFKKWIYQSDKMDQLGKKWWRWLFITHHVITKYSTTRPRMAAVTTSRLGLLRFEGVPCAKKLVRTSSSWPCVSPVERRKRGCSWLNGGSPNHPSHLDFEAYWNPWFIMVLGCLILGNILIGLFPEWYKGIQKGGNIR